MSYARVTVFAFLCFRTEMQIVASLADAICREAFTPADAHCGGMWLRLLPIFFSDHFFFSLLTLTQVQPPLLQGLEA